MKIAISGKGGVGKTTIMALLANQLQAADMDVLIIDADPSPHMAQTLGFKNIGKITPIAEMKDLLVERSGKTPGSPFYNINPKIDDLPARFMLKENNISIMVLGAIQTGDSGCACAENTVLRRLLTKLLLSPSQAVLLDMEAGVEHLGRGTIAGVDHLLVVVIPARSSIRTALKIKKLAADVGIPKVSFVGNLIESQEDITFLTEGLGESPAASFPNSAEIRKAERTGRSVTGTAAEFKEATRRLLDRIQGKGSQGTS